MSSTPLELAVARARDAPAPPAHVRCARCGYDLRGVMAGWRDMCPLAGTCAECGLLFSWSEMLNPRLGLPRWFVEYDAGRRLSLRQIASTLARSFWPWTFWTSIRMTHPHRWPRVAAYLVALSLVVYIFFAVGNGIIAGGEFQRWRSGPSMSSTDSAAAVAAHAALLPFSDTSIATVQAKAPRGIIPFPTSTPRYFVTTRWPAFFTWIAYGIAVQICCGLAHVLLPASRRKAKVRWAHIARITAYGLALMLPAILLDAVAFSLLSGFGARPSLLWGLAVVITVALMPMWLAWWSVADGRYLRMAHPWGVGLSVLVIGALTPLAVVALVWYATW